MTSPGFIKSKALGMSSVTGNACAVVCCMFTKDIAPSRRTVRSKEVVYLRSCFMFNSSLFTHHSSLLQYHVEREAVRIVVKLRVNGKRSHIGSRAEVVVQLSNDASGDRIIGKYRLHDFIVT